MDKLSRFFPACLLSIYCIKTLVFNATPWDALIIVGLVSLAILAEKRVQDKQFQRITEQLAQLENTLQENIKDTEQVRTHVSGMKLSQAKTPINLRF